MLYTFLVFVHIGVCLFLILTVLLQQGKGGGMGAAFGGGGAGTVFGGRGASTFLSKLTSTMAGLFLLLSILLARMSIDTSRIDLTDKDETTEQTTEGATDGEAPATEGATEAPAPVEEKAAAPVEEKAAPAEEKAAPAGNE